VFIEIQSIVFIVQAFKALSDLLTRLKKLLATNMGRVSILRKNAKNEYEYIFFAANFLNSFLDINRFFMLDFAQDVAKLNKSIENGQKLKRKSAVQEDNAASRQASVNKLVKVCKRNDKLHGHTISNVYQVFICCRHWPRMCIITTSRRRHLMLPLGLPPINALNADLLMNMKSFKSASQVNVYVIGFALNRKLDTKFQKLKSKSSVKFMVHSLASNDEIS
jgi:hypothetical protein